MFLLYMGFLLAWYLGAFNEPPTTAYTTRADCTRMAELYDKDILKLRAGLRIMKEQLKARAIIMEVGK